MDRAGAVGEGFAVKPHYERHGVRLIHGDALQVLPTLGTDRDRTVIITDPVWPNAPAGMFEVTDALKLFKAAAKHFSRLARRVVVILGCNSDPRFLNAMPARLRFVRAIWLRLVSRLTEPSDTVLDPFAGAGTTLLAARDHARQAVGIEVVGAYCDEVVRRLAQEPLFQTEWAPRPRSKNAKVFSSRYLKRKAVA